MTCYDVKFDILFSDLVEKVVGLQISNDYNSLIRIRILLLSVKTAGICLCNVYYRMFNII